MYFSAFHVFEMQRGEQGITSWFDLVPCDKQWNLLIYKVLRANAPYWPPPGSQSEGSTRLCPFPG